MYIWPLYTLIKPRLYFINLKNVTIVFLSHSFSFFVLLRRGRYNKILASFFFLLCSGKIRDFGNKILFLIRKYNVRSVEVIALTYKAKYLCTKSRVPI